MGDNFKVRAQSASVAASPDYRADGKPSNGGDPLAELARLIGQDDVFEQMRRDASRGAPPAAPSSADPLPPRASRDHAAALGASLGLRGSEEPNEPVPPPMPPRRASARFDDSFEDATPAAQSRASVQRDTPPLPPRRSAPPRQLAEEPVYRHEDPVRQEAAYRAEPAPARAAQQPASHRQQPAPQADPAYHDPAHDAAYGYYDEQAYDDQPPLERPRRRGVYAVAAVLCLAVIGTAGAYGYRAFTGGDGQPPVIKAAGTPAKMTPATTARDPAGRTTYDRSGSGQPERVVTREEQPVELREARSVAPRAPSASNSMVGMTGQAPAALSPPQPTANANEPKRVKTIPIRADGAAGQDPAAAPKASGARAAQQPAPVRTASIPQTPPPAAAAGGTHSVQIASQKTEEDARASFRTLQAKYPTVLGSRQPVIRKTDLGERGTFYRVQIGGFASADSANELCNNLKAAGGQCIVQRN